jgi:MFS family permease
MVGIVITGLPGALAMAGLLTLFQQNTGDSYRGRVFGAFAAVEGIAVLAGTLGGGYLSRPFGIIPVIAIQGAGYLIAGLLMAARLPGRVAAYRDDSRRPAPSLPPSADDSCGEDDGPGRQRQRGRVEQHGSPLADGLDCGDRSTYRGFHYVSSRRSRGGLG